MLTSDSRGREVILAVLEAGDYVGEMSLIDNEPHSATVRAEVQTDMLILGRAEFARCLPENSSSRTRSCAVWCSACAAPTGRSNRWPCSTSTAAARALLDMAEMENGVKLIRNKVSRQDHG